MPREYRTRAQVLRAVLTIIQEAGPAGVGITRLTTDANLTHGRIQEHLAGFQANGLVEKDEDSGTWRMTQRGHAALEELRRIDQSMRSFGIGL